MFIRYAFVFLSLIIAASCADTRQSQDKETDPILATFIANPRPVEETEVVTLAIGQKAPDFNLPATDGNFYSMNDFEDSEVLVVVFTCNHCPTAQAYEDRLIDVVAEYQTKGVAFVAISPNSPLGLLYEELGYSDLNDDYEEMIIRAKDKKFNFPYLYDGDDQVVSLKYGPVATPHVFLFDKERKLAYRGRLDGVEKPGTANAEDLRVAIDATLSGEPIANPTTKTFGCSTKWGWKLKTKERVNKEWGEREVKLSTIDKEETKKLLENNDSGKLRLINLWATWCGPCVIEYPQFVALQRMYGARDFEFVSISADNMENEGKVLKFLREKNSAVTNYLFSNPDKYELIAAFGEDWNGALPYTVLVEPGGTVVWKHQGEVDFYELKKVIVEHQMLGRYY
jgi:thiol-disulfide isomerase/thioredoxin